MARPTPKLPAPSHSAGQIGRGDWRPFLTQARATLAVMVALLFFLVLLIVISPALALFVGVAAALMTVARALIVLAWHASILALYVVGTGLGCLAWCVWWCFDARGAQAALSQAAPKHPAPASNTRRYIAPR